MKSTPLLNLTPLLLALLWTGVVFAQGRSAPSPQRVTLSDLPSHHITAMTEDARGYLWLGTRRGLARYSGNGLRIYTYKDDASALPSEIISALCTDAQGRLWVGTQRGVCVIRDHHVDSKIIFQGDLRGNLTCGFVDVDEGRLLVNDYLGLTLIDKSSGGVIQQTSHSDVQAAFRLLGTPSGHIYVVNESRRCVIVLSNKFETIRRFDLPNDVVVNDLALSADSSLVYVASTRGLFFVSDKDVRTFLPSAALRRLTAETDVAFVCAKDGRACLGIANQGIYLYDEATEQVSPLTTTIRPRAGEVCIALLTPQDLWLSRGHGLPERIALDPVREEIAIPDLWRDEYIYDLIPEDDGRFFLKGTYHIFLLDPTAMTCRDVTPVDIRGAQLTRSWTYSPVLKRFALSAQTDDVLIEYDWQDGQLVHPRRYPIGSYTCFWYEPDGLLCANQRDQVTLIAPNGQRTKQLLPANINMALSLRTDAGRHYLLDDSWVKLYTFDRQQGYTLLWEAPSAITSVSSQPGGPVWVGTFDSGAYCLDPADGRVLDHRDNVPGQPNGFIGQLCADPEGDLWLCTDREVIRVSTADDSRTTFLNPNEVNTTLMPSMRTALFHDGAIYFGGQHSFTRFCPGEARPGNHLPIAIDAVLVDGRKVNLGPDAVELEHDQDNLTIRYSALSLAPDAQLNYACMLEGYDHDFIDVGQSTTASYDHLRPGTYTFRARVHGPHGEWSEHELAQRIIVNYSPWLTPTLTRIYMVVVALLLALGIAYVVRRQRQHRALLRTISEMEQEKAAAMAERLRQTTGQSQAPPQPDSPPVTDPTALPADEVEPDVQAPEASEATDSADGPEPQSTATIRISAADRRLLERVTRLMEEHMDNEDFNVSSLAQELGMSRSSFYSRIKGLTGQSPQNLLTNYRLDRAMQLLQEHELNISEVCYRVGFGSLSGFSRSFKNKFGITPSSV